MRNDPWFKTILVAEDDKILSEVICLRLGVAGHKATPAYNGREALNQLQSAPPHLLVLDLTMPRIDGFQVLRVMRSDEALWRIPTLVLTARQTRDDIGKALALGADDYLAMPFEPERLLKRVDRRLREGRSAKALAGGRAAVTPDPRGPARYL